MSHPDDFPAGSVWLVGAGPGDAELLTMKAVRLINRADTIFYDALVGPGILALAGPGARLVAVGKRSGQHSIAQEDISQLLVDTALGGARVVRLKGGDPSIFGRAAEELDALAEAGIPVHICPGVTAASAASASAQASLTLRGVARRLTFVTAHARVGDELDLDWEALAARDTTLAIYMGRAAAPMLARHLIEAGRDAATPVLVAVDVSLPSERLLHGRLDTLGFLVQAISGDAPTLLIVGEAVARSRAEAALPAAVRNTGVRAKPAP
jgi:uroporphyrin-III C-methyltransferase